MVLLSKASTPNTCYWSWVPLVTLFSGECHRASLMKSQHWFMKWLVAIRQQAITWANFGPDICRHVASLVRQDFRTHRGFAILMLHWNHYDDVIMTMLASQITSLTVVYSIVYSGVNQRKHQSSASLAFVREIHRRPVNFPHKWPVTRKMFPFDDVIMWVT